MKLLANDTASPTIPNNLQREAQISGRVDPHVCKHVTRATRRLLIVAKHGRIMNTRNVCAKLRHPARSASADDSPYDEVLHKIDDNVLSIKLVKSKHRVETTDDERAAEPATPSISVDCVDKYGRAMHPLFPNFI